MSLKMPAVIEDWHEPRLKVKDESNRRPDLKDLRRHFRYRCEGIAGTGVPLLREEGWLRHQENAAQPPCEGADGVVSPG